jgi:ketosteroid isomerase-like protein
VTLSENGEQRWFADSNLDASRHLERVMRNSLNRLALVVLSLAPIASQATEAEDIAAVAALDTQYQAAVKANDAPSMARILADDFILVIGDGTVSTKADLLKEAEDRIREYTHQEDSEQTVRVWGDTAVVTARLWMQGTRKDGTPFDYQLWFSDTYVRTKEGWRYVFGQASLPLPKAS